MDARQGFVQRRFQLLGLTCKVTGGQPGKERTLRRIAPVFEDHRGRNVGLLAAKFNQPSQKPGPFDLGGYLQ